ncbi:hypothetical protein [Chelatococcus sp. YT9]|uniref:hypothetical protein n=1 Tax=Chelatococcus sp. YT9 TaxID=2835635 RepID=UPI0020BEC1DF|nr:hypothetical protein [Chelatococcus sp. YT9]
MITDPLSTVFGRRGTDDVHYHGTPFALQGARPESVEIGVPQDVLTAWAGQIALGNTAIPYGNLFDTPRETIDQEQRNALYETLTNRTQPNVLGQNLAPELTGAFSFMGDPALAGYDFMPAPSFVDPVEFGGFLPDITPYDVPANLGLAAPAQTPGTLAGFEGLISSLGLAAPEVPGALYGLDAPQGFQPNMDYGVGFNFGVPSFDWSDVTSLTAPPSNLGVSIPEAPAALSMNDFGGTGIDWGGLLADSSLGNYSIDGFDMSGAVQDLGLGVPDAPSALTAADFGGGTSSYDWGGMLADASLGDYSADFGGYSAPASSSGRGASTSTAPGYGDVGANISAAQAAANNNLGLSAPEAPGALTGLDVAAPSVSLGYGPQTGASTATSPGKGDMTIGAVNTAASPGMTTFGAMSPALSGVVTDAPLESRDYNKDPRAAVEASIAKTAAVEPPSVAKAPTFAAMTPVAPAPVAPTPAPSIAKAPTPAPTVTRAPTVAPVTPVVTPVVAPSLAAPISVPTIDYPGVTSFDPAWGVTGLAPSVMDNLSALGVGAPPDGYSYGYSPFGDYSLVHAGAPEYAQIAASGPGLFGPRGALQALMDEIAGRTSGSGGGFDYSGPFGSQYGGGWSSNDLSDAIQSGDYGGWGGDSGGYGGGGYGGGYGDSGGYGGADPAGNNGN